MAKLEQKRPTQKLTKPPDDIVNLYVKHLPVGDLLADEVPMLSVREFDPCIPTDIWLTLAIRRMAYQERGDAVALIEAFLSAHDAGLYPPMWVLDALAKGFHAYYRGQGEKPLADALGLNLGSGKSHFKESATSELHQQLALELFRLKTCFSLTIAESAEMLEAKLEQHPVVNKTKWKGLGKQYAAGTFTKKYPQWIKAARLDEADIDNPFHPDYRKHPWSKDRRKAFLTSFPRESWDHLLKKSPRLRSILGAIKV